MTFNPKAYVQRADQVVVNYEARKKWRDENKHLAIPFFVEALRDEVPAIYPEEMAVIGAPSGDGKTNIMKVWNTQIQNNLTESGRRAVTVFGSQEESTESLLADDIERRGNMSSSSRPGVFIGTSFGMNADEMDDIHMTNYLTAVDYTHREAFAEPMPIAANIYDYLQATPNDPLRRGAISDSAHHHQVTDNTRRLFKSAKQFNCPVITGSQTAIKSLKTPYNSAMPIPGRADFSDASGIYQIPDFVYSFMLMRNAAPVGKLIEIDNWSFEVEINLIFFWFLKARGHRPDTAPGISKVFPLWIEGDEYVYDAARHADMLVKKVTK